MKVGIITIFTALLLALPAFAGAPAECDGPDTDGDGTNDVCDNCSSLANATQRDGDQDGFGDACDCDFADPNNFFCDGTDFNEFAGVFNTPIGIGGTKCEFDMAQPTNSFIDGTDFNVFAGVFNTAPGPACTEALGTPCPGTVPLGPACP